MASLCARHLIIARLTLHSHKRAFMQSARCFQDLGMTEKNFESASQTHSSIQQHKLPLVTSRTLPYMTPYKTPKQAWLETLEQNDDEKLGIVDLHPEVFHNFPRLDLLWWNVFWQQKYKYVNYENVKNRAEMRGGGRKPWPQKGTGRARHGSIRSPLWKGGGKTFGPRGPRSYFFMLRNSVRLRGLTAALSVKLAQNNLHIVDSLNIPSDEPEYLQELVESRSWGLSVLFVDVPDVVPRNFALALDQIQPYNCMPAYGLNVYSMLKHETLVLTLAALEHIEEHLLVHLHNSDHRDRRFITKGTTKV